MIEPVLWLTLLAALQLPPPPPPPPTPPSAPRNAVPDAAPRKGTAIIRGRVTQQETGEPIARATVMLMTLMSSDFSLRPSGPPLQTKTAADGRYEFRDLPAGEYSLSADPGEFRANLLPQSLGDTRPPDSARLRPPRPLRLGDGEVRENANFSLWRAFAIEGRVVDEFGEPMSGVSVGAKAAETKQAVYSRGPYQFVSDDRGMFRVYGLSPGRYTVCAAPRSFGMPAVAEVKERPIETCYPAAAIEADAQVVAVTSGDVGGIDIRVQRSRAFTVSGTAIDSTGAPLERPQISLVRVEVNGGSSAGIEVRPGGRFIARGVIPGDYAIRAEIGGPYNQEDKREREIGYVPFRVENADVEGLLVATTKGAKVSGRVVFEDESASLGESPMRVYVMPDLKERMMSVGPQPGGRVNPDLTFELSGLVGTGTIMLSGAPRGWVVKSMRYNREDITDTPVNFAVSRDTGSLEIVLTNRGARISGRVTDERGSPASEARVVLLPVDPVRWKSPNAAAGGAMLKPDGAFQIGPVRAGEYLIAAVSLEEVPRGPVESDFFERVAKVAERISLVESEQRTIELRLVKVP